MRILLVDDEPDVLLALQELLRLRLRADVRIAASADEALKALGEGPVDLLVTDHRMPGVSGIDLIPLAKAKVPGLRCVLFTAYRDDALERRAKARGADVVLSKAVLPMDFTQRLLDVLTA
jgi:CheY-like chemotaxis protein